MSRVKRKKWTLQVKLGFTVKASDSIGGSTANLSKKSKGSLVSLNKVNKEAKEKRKYNEQRNIVEKYTIQAAGNIGGSLMSIGSKEKNHIKNIAKAGGNMKPWMIKKK